MPWVDTHGYRMVPPRRGGRRVNHICPDVPVIDLGLPLPHSPYGAVRPMTNIKSYCRDTLRVSENVNSIKRRKKY